MRAAEAGHPEAMNAVGQMLRLGAIGAVDTVAAVDWYERGAAAGSGEAATNAGRAYVNGWARPIGSRRGTHYPNRLPSAATPGACTTMARSC